MGNKLTDKQEEFCQQYVITLNAAEAVRQAGYQAKYPDRVGYEILQNEKIQSRLAELKKDRTKRTLIDQDKVVGTCKHILDKYLEQEAIDGTVAAKALHLLAAHVGMTEEKAATATILIDLSGAKTEGVLIDGSNVKLPT